MVFLLKKEKENSFEQKCNTNLDFISWVSHYRKWKCFCKQNKILSGSQLTVGFRYKH